MKTVVDFENRGRKLDQAKAEKLNFLLQMQTASGMTKFLTIELTGHVLGMSRGQIYLYRKQKLLETKYVGRKPFITTESINRLVMGELS